MKLSIIKHTETHAPDAVEELKIKYEHPNMEISKLEETNIVMTSLVAGDGEDKKYPNQW